MLVPKADLAQGIALDGPGRERKPGCLTSAGRPVDGPPRMTHLIGVKPR